jgi:sulfite reductase beta subunit-like hemoprotein
MLQNRAVRLLAAIDEHAENVRRFKAGEISPEAMRPLRLAMGVYAQLAHVKHMQRIKIPGGAITAKQLEALAYVTERWGRSLAHVTTRQCLQVHHLELDESVELQRALVDVGITTIGACADTVRNVTASPYAGVASDELFDVTPYAHAITEHFLFHPHNRMLPRKFKIGISGSAIDRAQAMINDLGLFASVVNGQRGFRVYVAGGLGSTPEIAHLWREHLPERDLFVAAEAIVEVYFRDGERKNRKKSRLKFLLRKIGEAELLRRLDVEFARIKEERGGELEAALATHLASFVEGAPPALAPGGEALGDAAFARWKRTNTLEQKQPGYRAVTVKLALGDITAAQLRALAEIARAFGNGEVRATNTQNFVLRWVPEGQLVRLHRALGLIGLAEGDADHITDVVSCPGGDYCSLAITKSMAVGASVREHLSPEGSRAEREDLVSALGPFAIKISGCPNSCGQHHVADIGMTGLMITGKDGVERPHYSLRVGGAVGFDARVGDRLDGRVPEEDAPKVIAAIARYYLAERVEGETFGELVTRVGPSAVGKAGLSASASIV